MPRMLVFWIHVASSHVLSAASPHLANAATIATARHIAEHILLMGGLGE